MATGLGKILNITFIIIGGESSTSPPNPVGEVVNGGSVSNPETVGAGVQGPADTGANVPPIGTTGSGTPPIVPSPATA